MKYILLFICHIISIVAARGFVIRDSVPETKHKIDLATRSPGQNQSGRLSRGTTPERKRRKSPPRAKSSPPARGTIHPKEALGSGAISGKGRISTVEQRPGRGASIKTALIHKEDSVVARGDAVSLTGQTFGDDSHMMSEVSGTLGFTSRMTTQTGGKGIIKAQVPGQASIRVEIEGNGKAEVNVPNRDPYLGCFSVECHIWGRGSSHLAAQTLRKRTMEMLEPD